MPFELVRADEPGYVDGMEVLDMLMHQLASPFVEAFGSYMHMACWLDDLVKTILSRSGAVVS